MKFSVKTLILYNQLHSLLVLRCHTLRFPPAPDAQEVHPQVLPELFVSDAVDHRAQEPRQDVDDQVVGKPDL